MNVMKRNTSVAQPIIRLIPVPALCQLTELGGEVLKLYLDFCYWHEPTDAGVQLPFYLAWQYHAGRLDDAIAELQARHLVSLEVAV